MDRVWHPQGTLYTDSLWTRPASCTFRADLHTATPWARDLTENVVRVTCPEVCGAESRGRVIAMFKSITRFGEGARIAEDLLRPMKFASSS
jgi:hypothetical protein